VDNVGEVLAESADATAKASESLDRRLSALEDRK
jgi:hypothetical protein